MIDKEIYEQVHQWMEAHKENMIHDIQRIVRIPSISKPEEEIKPFGAACRQAMDEMLQIGREHGFYTENYEYYVGSIGEKEKKWDDMIGFWNHLDVVPVGEGWDFDPFGAELKGDLLIGRGSQDNKGPAIGMLYVMECIRDLKLPVGHQLCLFVGSDEERKMADLEYYTKNYPTPAISMIADCGFPVCYGEKGIIEGKTVSLGTMSESVLEFYGGSAGNIIPDKAVLAVKKDSITEKQLEELKGLKQPSTEESLIRVEKKEDQIVVTAKGSGGHSAFPEESTNAIQVLCKAVLSAKILGENDRKILEAVCEGTSDNYGEAFGIQYEDIESGRLTCVGTMLRLKENHAELTFNIRYSITAKGCEITEKLINYWNGKGFKWTTDRDSAPSFFDPSHPAVGALTETYNELTDRSLKPYTMGGGTYARKLPRAFGFGIGNMPEAKKEESSCLRPGHGNAHGADEVLDCERLSKALEIYVMGLLALKDVKLLAEK